MQGRITLVILAVLAMALVGSSSAARRAAPRTLVVALDGRFTSQATSSGGFVAGGAVTDSGSHRDVTRVVPRTGRPRKIVITVVCRGKRGSFTFVATVPVARAGFIGPGTSISSAPGADRIVSATGAYKPLVGAVSREDLSYTSNPLQPGAPGAPRATQNALRVIDVFTQR